MEDGVIGYHGQAATRHAEEGHSYARAVAPIRHQRIVALHAREKIQRHNRATLRTVQVRD